MITPEAAGHPRGMRVSQQANGSCSVLPSQPVVKRHQRPICDLLCWSNHMSCFHEGISESELIFFIFFFLNKKESNENKLSVCSGLAFPALLQHLQAAKTWGEKEPRKMFYMWIRHTARTASKLQGSDFKQRERRPPPSPPLSSLRK